MNARTPALRVVDGPVPVPAPAPAPALSAEHQLLLATWLSTAFPVGGFAYSHGIETAIVEGRIADSDGAAAWVCDLIERGSGWCDALLLAAAARASGSDDVVRLDEVAELATALAPSRERQRETLDLGTAFFKAVTAGWPCPALDRLRPIAGERVAYPVAVGVAAAGHGIPLEPTIAGYLNSFATGLLSVAVRLVPLGQTAGLKALAALHPVIRATAARAATGTLDDLGSATIVSDIASMRHETLYSRVFRS